MRRYMVLWSLFGLGVLAVSISGCSEKYVDKLIDRTSQSAERKVQQRINQRIDVVRRGADALRRGPSALASGDSVRGGGCASRSLHHCRCVAFVVGRGTGQIDNDQGPRLRASGITIQQEGRLGHCGSEACSWSDDRFPVCEKETIEIGWAGFGQTFGPEEVQLD